MVFRLPLEIHEHHDEQVQDHDAAGIHEHLDDSEELRRQQHVQRSHREKVQHQKQHRVDGVLRGHHEQRESEDERGDDVKRDRVAHYSSTFTMPVAMMLAMATGINTFHPSRMSWSYR